MMPGEFCVLVGSEEDALRARSEGLHLRDTLLILLPRGGVLTAFLFRSGLEGTVAENVLKHGSGGLWIDGCRVACESGDRADRLGGTAPKWGTNTYAQDAYSLATRGSNSPANALGRWPTNLLLVHGSGCRCLGALKVRGLRSATPSGWDRVNAKQAALGYRPGSLQKGPVAVPASRLGEDGLVAAWDCEPGCPVRVMDEQSGDCKTTWIAPEHQNRRSGDFLGAVGHPGNQGYNDSGGASRFYPQFPCLAEAIDWLSRLVNGPS
jgi:hypothetical protein